MKGVLGKAGKLSSETIAVVAKILRLIATQTLRLIMSSGWSESSSLRACLPQVFFCFISSRFDAPQRTHPLCACQELLIILLSVRLKKNSPCKHSH